MWLKVAVAAEDGPRQPTRSECCQRLRTWLPLPHAQLHLHSGLAQHVDQRIDAELVDFTPQQVVQAGWLDPEPPGRPRFGQPSRDFASLGHESGSEQQILRFDVGKSELRK
jgi:hypothetical protein